MDQISNGDGARYRWPTLALIPSPAQSSSFPCLGPLGIPAAF